MASVKMLRLLLLVCVLEVVDGRWFEVNKMFDESQGRPESVFTKTGDVAADDDTLFGRRLNKADVKLWEGDIVYTKEIEKIAKGEALFDTAVDRQWTNRVIPYTIENQYWSDLVGPIQAAVNKYNEQLDSCVQWVRYNSESDITSRGIKNYILFTRLGGCWSFVGMNGGVQKISLGATGTQCLYQGTVMHEMLHAMGFWHEQSRDDRDQYIAIDTSKIMQGMEYNFAMKRDADKLGFSYDIDSVMHYPPHAFSIDGSPTIRHLGGKTDFGSAQQLSEIDIKQIKKYYSCPNQPVDGGCITTSGPSAGKRCIFPYTFNGVKCQGPRCCNLDNDAKGSWCSTKVDANGVHVSGGDHWAYCAGTTCDGDGGPVDGGWSSWGPYGSCSKSCGGGSQTSVRRCNNPTPMNGGQSCSGDDSRTKECNTTPCPTSPEEGCVDQSHWCPRWASNGECTKTEAKWMAENCCKSCKAPGARK